MPKYKTQFTHDKIDFTEIENKNNIALFEGSYQVSGLQTYEIHVLREKRAHPKSEEAGKMILCSPSESEWGIYGFTYQTKEQACAKFEKLVQTTHKTSVFRQSGAA